MTCALALSADGNHLVAGDTASFGGGFQKHNGIVQANLGAVSTTSGTKAVPVPLSSFSASTNGIVYALAMTGSRLVVR